MNKISFKNVCKTFESGHQVLRGVSLDISSCESRIILGKSGCGKSVLIKCLLGLIKISSGDIIVDDISVHDSDKYDEYVKKFSILFQGNALFDSMTILENVEFGLKQTEKDPKTHKDIAKEKLLAVGLDHHIFDLYPAELSGGMQKRAALARAIAIEPEILLFDEPTTGLDPITGEITCNLLKNTMHNLGITVITITHDIKVAEFLGDSVSVLNEGNVVWTGKPQDMKNCDIPFVSSFYKASVKISEHT